MMATKTCFKCLTEKDISDFYKHSMMSDGHLGKCKECAKRDVRDHRKTSPNPRIYDKKRWDEDANRRAVALARSAQFKKDKPWADKAHRAVHRAIKRGKLKRLPCEICGDAKSQGHHEDYDKKLDVRWLCQKCHSQLHHSGK